MTQRLHGDVIGIGDCPRYGPAGEKFKESHIMRSAPVRNLAIALAISCAGRLASAQTPAPPPPPAAETPPPPPPAPVPPADAPMPPPPVLEAPPPPPPPTSVSVVVTPATPPPASSGPTVTTKLVSATLYGYLQADAIYDSTQSFNDSPNNGTLLHTAAQ